MVHYQPKIMVLDDDEGIRSTLAEILEDEGYDVTTVSESLWGVAVAANSHFDLIFIDFKMPGINGLEAFRRIKSLSPETIVIMVTGYAGSPIEDALEEGAYAVLYKPFDSEQLTDLVRTTLRSTGNKAQPRIKKGKN